MKKLIFTLFALAAAAGAQAQTTEAEEYAQATAAANAAIAANEEALAPLYSINFEDRTEAEKAELALRQNMRDTLYNRLYEATLTALERREPPFSPIFVMELRSMVSSAYAWSNASKQDYGPVMERAAKLWERLSDEQKASNMGQEMKRYLFPYPKAETGSPVPDAELYGLDGSVHRLSDYTGKGTYVLMDFWRVGCGPCIMAMPELKKIYEANKEILTVVGINNDYAGGHDRWANISEQHAITWPNLSSPHMMDGELENRFRLVSWPHQVIISPDGVILDSWSGFGPGYLRAKLQENIPELK
jgi:thiol-disulfide isomerase/thioredoxin